MPAGEVKNQKVNKNKETTIQSYHKIAQVACHPYNLDIQNNVL